MKNSAPVSSVTLISRLGYFLALLIFSCATMLVYGIDPPWQPFMPGWGKNFHPILLTGGIGILSAQLLSLSATRRFSRLSDTIRDALIPMALLLACSPKTEIWQAPTNWSDIFDLSPISAGFIAMGHALLLIVSLSRNKRHPGTIAQLSLLASPFVFNWLLVLQTPALLQHLASLVPGASLLTPRGLELFGRMLVLAGFNVAVAVGLNALCIGVILKQKRPYILLLGSAAYCGLTPLIADLGSNPTVAALPWLAGCAIATLSVALAQAGLWAQTYLLTGLLMDALKGRRPTGYWGHQYFREGLGKGAVYSALFLAILFFVQFLVDSSWMKALQMVQPLLGHVLLGIVIMPLGKTVLESFDGSRPFFVRLGISYREPHLYLRGALLGLGLYIFPVTTFIHQSEGWRFGVGALLGAVTYAGASILLDGIKVVRGQRLHLQTWRVYLTGILLGGFVGGAIAWYVDVQQSQVILNKFRAYVTLYNDSTQPYSIWPLFSKWGSMKLGLNSGSSRLLFNESVSGVINWSLAAPLFSVNFFFLTALFARSMAPIRLLFSRQGGVAVAEQTVRVLRWGLWMAPVIYSLLRISPDPTWYNQDGAIRTLTAIWQTLTLSPEAFRGWSVQTFMYILAYDWFRIVVWFDHMGLRVATLVNLSFVGGDVLDELLARFQGHPGRSRCIPEALRRFATWAPLLIPFFLPMGSDWSYVWDKAESIQKMGIGQASPILIFLVFCMLVAVIGNLLLKGKRAFSVKLRPGLITACGLQRPGFCPPDEIVLHNGVYTSVIGRDGRGYSRTFSGVLKGREYDLTNRPTSRAHDVGKFVYLREKTPGTDPRPWTLGCRPARRRSAVYSTEELSPLSVRQVCVCQGVETRVEISLPQDGTYEITRIKIINREHKLRRLELTTYREMCINDPNPQLRHPFYNRQHMATWFVPEQQAIFGSNRTLKTPVSTPEDKRPSSEVYFHAILSRDRRVHFMGYEDSRNRFVGDETLLSPALLFAPPSQTMEDDMHYTFDPIASLRLSIELEPKQSVEVLLIDGYAPSAEAGSQLIENVLHLTPANIVHPTKPTKPSRKLIEPLVEAMLKPEPHSYFAFSDDGDELHLPWKTPRRWAHLMANQLGYGTLATNDGALASFMGNSQQNALTLFSPDSMTTQNPGQIFYLHDLQSGEISSPTYVPFRDKAAEYDITCGLGFVTFRKKKDHIASELTAFVLPDAPVEARLLKIRNTSDKPVNYVVTFCAQMVLAEVPVDSLNQITTDADSMLNALFFNRPENRFQQGWAFVAMSNKLVAQETVLNRFVGEGRDFHDPIMVTCGQPDPEQSDDGYRVAAMSTTLSVPAGGEACLHVLIGQEQDKAACRLRIRALQRTEDVEAALARTKAWWRETLGVINVESDSPAFDRLVNYWLPYQVLTARLWGRLGPQQRSGAFGFRDQLQDALPLIFIRPEVARSQIILHCKQQFHEGDAFQWWHQTWDGKTGLGMRNHASDPHLWLPYLASRYVRHTGDLSILDEQIPFLEGKPIPRGEEGMAFVPRQSRDVVSLYEHCMCAIDCTLKRIAPNGLPYMGAHDWNDGLNAVGVAGTGTSVWLGFFLYDVLHGMSDLIETRENKTKADHYRAKAADLQKALDAAWREDHYIRAITDNGEELDYADALCSSWPILSGAAMGDKGETALVNGLKQLEKPNMVLLLSPHFDEDSKPYPGRIAEYPPGVRENGAQYSHGASWLVDALAEMAHASARAGHSNKAAYWRNEALRVWLKISPLAHTLPEELPFYGLPPHQQAADIYYGQGFEGRGGWSWYTGAAARMLWAAYSMLGIGLEDGRPAVSSMLLEAEGPLKIRRVKIQKMVVYSAEDEE